jgi:hypothetical protein
VRSLMAARRFREFNGCPRMYCPLAALFPISSHYLSDFLYMFDCLSKSRDGGAGARAALERLAPA